MFAVSPCDFGCLFLCCQALSQMFREVKLEVQVVQQLRHPSIVSFMGAAAKFPTDRQDTNDWTLGLIFELCDGGQLNKLLHNPDNTPRHMFSSAEKLRMAKDISIGIAYLHSLRYMYVCMHVCACVYVCLSKYACMCVLQCVRVRVRVYSMDHFMHTACAREKEKTAKD